MYGASQDSNEEDTPTKSKVLLNITSEHEYGMDHKIVIKNEIQKEIQYMKDLVLSQIYDLETKSVNFSHTDPEHYDDIFFNALRDMLSNDEIKVKHILLTSSDERMISNKQLELFLDTFGNFSAKNVVHKTLDFTGNKKLTTRMAVDLGKLIKWKKNADVRNISHNNTQVFVLDGMQFKKPEVLHVLLGKHISSSKWINYLTELSLSGCSLTDDHLSTLCEDSFKFFRVAPLLKTLNLSYNMLSLHS